jgi:hypothetical protein
MTAEFLAHYDPLVAKRRDINRYKGNKAMSPVCRPRLLNKGPQLPPVLLTNGGD